MTTLEWFHSLVAVETSIKALLTHAQEVTTVSFHSHCCTGPCMQVSSTIFHCQNTCPLHLFYQLASMDLARMVML